MQDETGQPANAPWWRSAVIYQIYPRSFADSDGDGVGDLPGIRSRLPYLRELGVDAVWISPFYPSPMADAGYDVSDYRDIEPIFGTLADADAMLADAHELGIRVIIDLVPNHTSDEHEWFRAALAAAPGSPERARYIFRDGRGEHGEIPPNDWISNFGGPAWTRVTESNGSDRSGHDASTPRSARGGRPAPDQRGQWYLHLFDPKQPDLDWTNPEVVAEFESILRFWLDRGIDGFRIDVAHGLAKDPEMPDLEGNWAIGGPAVEGHPHWDRDEVHDVYRGWRRVTDSYDGDRVFVGEVWVQKPEQLARYLRSDELHTAFNFTYLLASWDAKSLHKAIDDSIDALSAVGAPATWVLSNHDVVRHVTRYGGGAVGVRRARAAALLTLALPGGAYVYQGEELGLAEVTDLPPEVRQDPAFARYDPGLVRADGGGGLRDGCRVPIPWSGDAPPFGFGPGSGQPWLPQPADWAALTVERQQADPVSMLALYQAALELRRDRPELGDGTMAWIDTDGDVLAFRRDPGFVCVVNVGGEPVAAPDAVRDGALLLSSDPLLPDGRLPGTTSAWYAV